MTTTNAVDVFSPALCLSSLLVAIALLRATRGVGVPPVMVMLLSGMAVRGVFRDVVDGASLSHTARPAVDLCLAVIGLLIGTHMNQETLSGMGRRVAAFLAVFFTTGFVIMWGLTNLMLPQHARYAPLVAAIALERSSPEALAGISEAKAAGPFTTTTIITAVAMDVVALILYVVLSAFVAPSSEASPAWTLFHLFGSTVVATLLSWALLVTASARLPRLPPAASVIAVATLLTLARRVFHFELLLAAIMAGSAVNFRQPPHPVAAALEAGIGPVNILLFSLCGLRIDVVSLIKGAAPLAIVGLFAARLVSLWGGGYIASRFSGMGHGHARCLALVTQLAIALSLVNRLHDTFPDAAPLTDSLAGMVLCGLMSGPPLLHLSLRIAGEVGGALTLATPPTCHADDSSPSKV